MVNIQYSQTDSIQQSNKASQTLHEFSVIAEPPDAGGKVRAWSIHAPNGTKLGCVTTKRGATKIADLLTRFVGSEQAL